MNTETFWDRIDASGDCWEWTGGRGSQGRYGGLKFGGRTTSPHQVAWETLVGPIPAGLELDHLCRNRVCVNPAHLEPVTHQENMRRGLNRLRTHCKFGHRLVQAKYQRRCQTCRNETSRLFKARKRAAA